MNLVRYCLLSDWTVREVLKMSAILVQYPILEGFFTHFHGLNKYEIRLSVYYRVRTKKVVT